MSTATAAKFLMGYQAARPAPPAPHLSGWTEDLARAISADNLKKLNASVLDSMDQVSKAHDALNEFENNLNTLDARKAEVAQEFGPPFIPGFTLAPNWPSLIALAPLLQAEAYLRVGGRRLAAIDVLFYELSLSYTGMANALSRAGLDREASSLRRASLLMRGWRGSFQAKVVPRMPSVLEDREAIERDFVAALAAKGLRRIIDDEKPGYFDALGEALRPYTEEPTPDEVGTLQGARLGVVDPVTLIVLALIGIIVIGATLVAISHYISKSVEHVWGASNKAMDAAREWQRRKTLREEQVQAQIEANERAVQEGTLSREEADDRNKQAREQAEQDNQRDGEEFQKGMQAAGKAAAEGAPGLGDLLLWVGVPVLGLGGLALGLKIAGVF